MEFWDLTYGEVLDLIKVKEKEIKRQCTMTYTLGALFKAAIVSSFDDKAKFPEPYQIFPILMEEAQEQTEQKQSPVNSKEEIMKANLLRYAREWNSEFRKRKEGKG